MNESVIKAFDTFQIADLDDDMVGMCKALVDWIKVLRRELPKSESFPDAEPPERFFKMHPHQPKMELRKNLRKLMAHAVKYQKEHDPNIKLKNIYVVILAATYLYHMPTDLIIQQSMNLDSDFSRDQAKKLLLDDDMSPNWLKEPSGKDFTAIML